MPEKPQEQGSSPDASAWREITAVQGISLSGGSARIRVRLTGIRGLLLEVAYPAGVGSPEHIHQHDSYVFILSGHLIGTVAGRTEDLGPGDTVLHAAGVSHSLAAITDTRWLEFKTPPQIVWS
jgi:quercetin dioxygenase-like cupin family protein